MAYLGPACWRRILISTTPAVTLWCRLRRLSCRPTVLRHPAAGARHHLHRAERAGVGDPLLLPAGLLPGDGQREVGVHPVPLRDPDDQRAAPRARVAPACTQPWCGVPVAVAVLVRLLRRLLLRGLAVVLLLRLVGLGPVLLLGLVLLRPGAVLVLVPGAEVGVVVPVLGARAGRLHHHRDPDHLADVEHRAVVHRDQLVGPGVVAGRDGAGGVAGADAVLLDLAVRVRLAVADQLELVRSPGYVGRGDRCAAGGGPGSGPGGGRSARRPRGAPRSSRPAEVTPVVTRVSQRSGRDVGRWGTEDLLGWAAWRLDRRHSSGPCGAGLRM